MYASFIIETLTAYSSGINFFSDNLLFAKRSLGDVLRGHIANAKDHVNSISKEQFLELTTQKPGFSVGMLKVRKNEKAVHSNVFKKMLYGKNKTFGI